MLARLLRNRLVLVSIALSTIFLTLSIFNRERIQERWQGLREQAEHKDKIPGHPPWKFKPEDEGQVDLPVIEDNFPSASYDLPPIPEWNVPPPHWLHPQLAITPAISGIICYIRMACE